MKFETQSKWQDFLDGFRNIYCILDCYDDYDEWGMDEFWESLSIGWMQQYIFDYDDPYNLTISKERKLRLSQEPQKTYLSPEDFDALVKKIEEPPKYNENLAKLMNRKSPFTQEQ